MVGLGYRGGFIFFPVSSWRRAGSSRRLFSTFVNGWMNAPAGFDLVDGKFVNIHPFTAMLNPAGIPEAVQMVRAAYTAPGFATAGIHGWLLLRRGRNRFDEVAIGIALLAGGVAVILQSVSGDALARMVAEKQPMKLASLEGQVHTEIGAPLRIGGIPFPEERETKYAIEIPHGLSLLGFHKYNALIKGLDQEPQSDWPNVRIVHLCFQTIVACAGLLSPFAVASGWISWKKRPLHTLFLKALVLVSPLGFVALEAGWMVTEVGRQPCIFYPHMRNKDAVPSMPNVTLTFSVMAAVYVILGIVVVWLLSRHVIAAPETKQIEHPEVLV